jgi:hypothetical protein
VGDGHHPDLAGLLADPARAAEVSAEDRQALLDALAVHEGRCRQVRDLLTGTMARGVETRDGAARGRPAYALDEAAGLLLKSPAWLRRQAKTGRVGGARKVGRSWLFDRAPFDRWRSRPAVG